MRLLLFVLRMLVLNPLYHFNPAAKQKKPRNFRMKMRDFFIQITITTLPFLRPVST